ncbi:hypothetical protein GGI12_000377 [Dipsacomyces acuminosporus]|nr:hypothetical protein GGI12_000377 [Dipsacomyces acuminosporus]
MLYVHTSILPDTPYVILRGTAAEASGQVLSGRIMVRLGHSLKVKTVSVAFHSAAATKYIYNRQSPLCSDILMEQQVFSAENTPRGYATWATGDKDAHEFPFSFAIPGNLHESVNTDFGNACYELKVVIRTCGFGINLWTESMRIPVFRIPEEGSPWAIALVDSLQLQADWLGAVELQLLSDAVAYTDRSQINIRAIVRPLQKNQRLIEVGLRLREHIRYKSVVNRFGDVKDSIKAICECSRKTSDPESGGLHALSLQQEHPFDMSLEIPKAFHGVQFDMESPQVHIAHEVMLFATILDRDSEPHYLSISAPVMIVPSMAIQSSHLELPAYDSTNEDRLLLSSPPESDIVSIHQAARVQPVPLPSLLLQPPSYQSICAARPSSSAIESAHIATGSFISV